MPVDPTTLIAAGVLFAATLVRATFGFGDALVAMPLLAMILPVRVAAPIVAILSVATAVMIMWRDWQHVDYGAALRLVLSAVVGLPFGVILLHWGNERIVKGLLAVVVLAISLFRLMRHHHVVLKTDRFAPLAGFLAGVLGGAYNTHGPPLVVYGVLRGWSTDKFRATLQGYFLPTGCCLLAAHAIGGLWTKTVLSTAMYCVPGVVIATILGRKLSGSFDTVRFNRAVNILLILIGLGLVWNVFAA